MPTAVEKANGPAISMIAMPDSETRVVAELVGRRRAGNLITPGGAADHQDAGRQLRAQRLHRPLTVHALREHDANLWLLGQAGLRLSRRRPCRRHRIDVNVGRPCPPPTRRRRRQIRHSAIESSRYPAADDISAADVAPMSSMPGKRRAPASTRCGVEAVQRTEEDAPHAASGRRAGAALVDRFVDGACRIDVVALPDRHREHRRDLVARADEMSDCRAPSVDRDVRVPIRAIGSDQADPRHPASSVYRCFLPDLTRFTRRRCAGPGPQRRSPRRHPRTRASGGNSALLERIAGTGHR